MLSGPRPIYIIINVLYGRSQGPLLGFGRAIARWNRLGIKMIDSWEIFASIIFIFQVQICSLLANAFFCTFPNRNSRARRSEYANYPSINFNGLYGFANLSRKESQMEKLKCLINYFRRRIDGMAGQSLVTFSRRCIGKIFWNFYDFWI